VGWAARGNGRARWAEEGELGRGRGEGASPRKKKKGRKKGGPPREMGERMAGGGFSFYLFIFPFLLFLFENKI
jgi:hypothetical protein